MNIIFPDASIRQFEDGMTALQIAESNIKFRVRSINLIGITQAVLIYYGFQWQTY